MCDFVILYFSPTLAVHVALASTSRGYASKLVIIYFMRCLVPAHLAWC